MAAEHSEKPTWYVAASHDQPLEQGDILRSCTVPIFGGKLPVALTDDGNTSLVIDFDVIDLIILSQSCDIAVQEGKPRRITGIVTCPVWELATLRERNPAIDRSGYIGEIIKGRVPLWYALAPSGIPGLEREHSFAEFGQIMVIPAEHLEAVAQ